MTGITDLDRLLKSMSPQIQPNEFVFCTVSGELTEYVGLKPLASFNENEGLTLVLPLQTAERANLTFHGKFKQITLRVHSSLEAVGLTAAISNKLTEQDISANVVAAYYHDHVFVPHDKAEMALKALQSFAQ